MKKQLISPDASYTFFDYFKLDATTEEVLEYFGVSFETESLKLPYSQHELDRLENLLIRLEESFSLVGMTNETARREFLIAPVISEAAHYAKAKIRVEYVLDAGPQLKGSLDYFLKSKNNLLVVEAKNADLTKGFTQMSVELLAIDKLMDEDTNLLYGTVSLGNIWQFGTLDRKGKKVTQDLNVYSVPADVEDLLRILIGILE